MTSNDSTTTKAPEAPVTEAPVAEAPEATKAKVNYEELCTTATQAWITARTVENVTDEASKEADEAFQTAWAAFPKGARRDGPMTSLVLAADPSLGVPFLDLVNNLPTTTGKGRTAPKVADEATQQALRDLVKASVEELGHYILAYSQDDLANEFLVGLGGAVNEALASYNGLTRTRKDSLAQILAYSDSPIKAGVKVKGPNGASGTITAKGQITTKGTACSVSKSAEVNIGTTAKGKQASQNGYTFWTVKIDGADVTLDSLRRG